MDNFGIGAAINGSARIYLHSARRTGRTTALVQSLKNGDRVVFLHRHEADRVRKLCLERDVKIECLISEVKHPMEIKSRHGSSEGRTLFDHSWVEQYYLCAIERAQEELASAEQQLSGYDAEYSGTLERASEISKWRF